jgi:hypothetical protein
MVIGTNMLILIGVGAQLLGMVAKEIFTKPQQQAQVDSIETKVDNVLNQVNAVQTTIAQVPAAVKAAQAANTAGNGGS